jgi:hypothetical protein
VRCAHDAGLADVRAAHATDATKFEKGSAHGKEIAGGLAATRQSTCEGEEVVTVESRLKPPPQPKPALSLFFFIANPPVAKYSPSRKEIGRSRDRPSINV